MSEAVIIAVPSRLDYGAIARGDERIGERRPFRQSAIWAGCAVLFFAYLTVVLYAFTANERFRDFVVRRANALFAVPYILSVLVVLVCLAPCTPPPRRDLDGVIASPVDFCLVVLVLVEWATCLALVLVTLIAVHDGLSYISPDGFIVPNVSGEPNPEASGRDGMSRDAIVVLVIPLLLMYALFNFCVHIFSYLEGLYRRRYGLDDDDNGQEASQLNV